MGIAVVAALISTLLLVALANRAAFAPALLAVLCIVATQVVFWTLTFPVNRRTRNWTSLPENWTTLRRRWEYSHAGSAVLNLAALICVMLATLAQR